MNESTSDREDLKRAAAAQAVGLVASGMRIGLGTGSTVAHFLELLGRRLRDGDLQDVVGVPTSVHTTDRAHALGIPLGELHELAPLDLTVDGADEVDPSLDLIKGLGGALLREKIVAGETRRFVIIGDGSKRVERLGTRSPVPVEVAAFAWRVHLPFLRDLGARPVLRTIDGVPFTTDNGNYCIDCHFSGGIPDPRSVEQGLALRPGVVGSGLFLGMAERAILATEEGVETLTRKGSPWA